MSRSELLLELGFHAGLQFGGGLDSLWVQSFFLFSQSNFLGLLNLHLLG